MSLTRKFFYGMLAVGISLAIAALPGLGSEKKVKLQDLPAAVQKTVAEQSKGATIRGFAEETEGGKTYYEVEMTVNGHNRDVLMDPSGAVVEVESELSLDSAPAPVRATLEKKAGAGKILKVESITKNNGIEAYEAVIDTGGKKSEIKVAPDGKLITPKK